MKRCPTCNRTYTDESIKFCLEDGTPLLGDAPQFDPNATIVYSAPRETAPPPTEVYPADPRRLNQAAPMPQPPRPQMPLPQVPKKSNAVWWILGAVAVLVVIGVGLFIMILAIASMSRSNSNHNQGFANTTSTERPANRNTNTSKANNANENGNSSSLPSSFSDDFSSVKWGTGDFTYGDIWYANDEFHMRSKDKTFLVMYAPSNDYNTENATVRVTARSVDGNSPSSGYGLIVHGEKSNDNSLEDYAFLIYSNENPQFEVVEHKGGNQTTLVPWTKSSVIRSGTSPNQLEVRVKDRELSFYINGQYVTSISDSGNFRRGVAGFYTSDTSEVAFDDLEITR